MAQESGSKKEVLRKGGTVFIRGVCQYAPLYVSVYFGSLQIVSLKVREGNFSARYLNVESHSTHNFGLVFGQKFLPNALIAYLTTWECDSTIFLQIRLPYL